MAVTERLRRLLRCRASRCGSGFSRTGTRVSELYPVRLKPDPQRGLCALALLLLALPATAAVLPEDRADVLYHSYDGGGVTIDGPSILVRKQVGSSVSVYGNYYVDSISSASIDVVTTASRYTEEREEKSLGLDYLRGKSTLSLGYTHSEENDFEAHSLNFSVAQDFFGDLTTLTLGFALGDDTVGKRGDPSFEREAERRQFRFSVSQILSKNLITSLAIDTVSDEGYLNNPYRTVRYVDFDSALGYSYQPERYPNTRTSTAVGLRGLYYLPYRAALKAGYRYYSDTWGIVGHTTELGYTHPTDSGWIIDLNARVYRQTAADFYADLYPYADAQNFLARDKELAAFDNHSLGIGLSYEFGKNRWAWIDRASVNVSYERIWFDYENFRDLRHAAPVAGEEPRYSFAADVLQLYLSVWF